VVIKIPFKLILAAYALFCSLSSISMMDLREEIAETPGQTPAELIMSSASLSDAQKQAIQAALSKIFIEQASSTEVYSQIVSSLVAALGTAEVTESSKRFVAGLKDLIKVFFKNVKFTGEQSAKVRDVLETLKALAILQMDHLNPESINGSTKQRIVGLYERLVAHSLPLSIGIQGVLTQELMQDNQKHILALVLDLIKDVLTILPTSKADGNPPAIAQPIIPDRIEQTEEFETSE